MYAILSLARMFSERYFEPTVTVGLPWPGKANSNSAEGEYQKVSPNAIADGTESKRA